MEVGGKASDLSKMNLKMNGDCETNGKLKCT